MVFTIGIGKILLNVCLVNYFPLTSKNIFPRIRSLTLEDIEAAISRIRISTVNNILDVGS